MPETSTSTIKKAKEKKRESLLSMGALGECGEAITRGKEEVPFSGGKTSSLGESISKWVRKKENTMQ